MAKIYFVSAYFEIADGWSWKTLGLFTDELVAKDTKSKWEKFYESSSDSLIDELNDIYYSFKKIVIEEYDIDKDLSFNDSLLNDGVRSLMRQWDRDWKLKKL